MKFEADVRNKLDMELARCAGGVGEETPAEVYGKGWVVQPKLNGLRKSLQIGTSRVWLVGRNRKNKTRGAGRMGPFIGRNDWGWTEELLGRGVEGVMLDGEVHTKGEAVSEATTAFAYEPELLRYCVFDCLFWKGRDVRELPYRDRLEYAGRAVRKLGDRRVYLIETHASTKENVQKILKRGGEGVVFADGGDPYGIGRWKQKSMMTIDVVITGCSEKKSGGSPSRDVKARPTGLVAAADTALWKKDKLVHVGWMMGLERKDKDLTLAAFRRKYVGKVAEATCSGFAGGRLSWTRFLRWRDDKSSKDCQWKEQIGRVSGS